MPEQLPIDRTPPPPPEPDKPLPGKKEMRRTIIDLAWPVVLELMMVSLLSMVNMIMVGHLGTDALAAGPHLGRPYPRPYRRRDAAGGPGRLRDTVGSPPPASRQRARIGRCIALH